MLPTCHSYGNQLVNHGNGLVEQVSNRIHQGTDQLLDGVIPGWQGRGGQLVSQASFVVDEISQRFDSVLTMIDQGGYNGKEQEIYSWQPQLAPGQLVSYEPPVAGKATTKSASKSRRKSHSRDHPKVQATAATAAVSGSFFGKVDSYANSRLPMNLPPLKLCVTPLPRSSEPTAANYCSQVHSHIPLALLGSPVFRESLRAARRASGA